MTVVQEIIANALREDIGDGDHSTLACVPENARGKAQLIIKDNGVLAGVELAIEIFRQFDPSLKVTVFKKDGEAVSKGEIAFTVEGASRSILTTERLVLNFMQRMSGIATQTAKIVQKIDGLSTKLLDTRKTTPGIRYMEKWAVRIGGGHNHRFALYDMIMLKDNHLDYAGGITQAVAQTRLYLKEQGKNLKIEVEVRTEAELLEAIQSPGIDRIMLDNFQPADIKRLLPLIPSYIETEASGGITLESIREYAETGVQFISVGALTHSAGSLDLSLKAFF